MEDITVTIKAVDLAKLIKEINYLKDDLNFRNMKIKKLENEIEQLKKENEK